MRPREVDTIKYRPGDACALLRDTAVRVHKKGEGERALRVQGSAVGELGVVIDISRRVSRCASSRSFGYVLFDVRQHVLLCVSKIQTDFFEIQTDFF